jgi:hypothetical protein
MKLIKTLLILTIIGISLCVEMSKNRISRKKVKHTKSKAKSSSNAKILYDGSGSWEEGYECPGIEVSANGLTFEGAQRVRFNPKALVEFPESSNAEGLYFTLVSSDPQANANQEIALNDKLQKFLKKDSRPGDRKNSWYLPYRYIRSVFKFVGAFYDFSTIEGWVTNDARETSKFRLKLPWRVVGYFITNEQALMTCQKINEFNLHKLSQIWNMKQTVRSGSMHYALMSQQQKIAGKQDSEKAKAKEEIEKEFKAMEDKLKEWQDKYNKNQEEINKKEIELFALKKKQQDLSIELEDRVQSIKILKSSVVQLTQEKEKTSKTKEEIQIDVDNSENNFKLKVENLLSATPDLKEEVKTTIRTQTAESLKKPDAASREAGIITALRLIYP